MRGVTPTQEKRYRQDGYLSFHMSRPGELASLRSHFDRAFATDRRRGALMLEHNKVGKLCLEKVGAPERRFPELLDTTLYRRGKAIAARLLRVDPGYIHITGVFIRKPPRGGITEVHQHPNLTRPPGFVDAVTIWMTLDGVDRDDGCLTFLPGSHRKGLLPYDEIIRTLPSGYDAARMVGLPLPPGGAVAIHDLVLHGALANRTPRARRAAALYCMRMKSRTPS
jgi:phytanoyl-CoA hydroxylase